MAYLIGKDMILKVGAEALAGATSCNISLSSETIDTTSKESGDWVEYLGSMKSWSVDSDGLFAAGQEQELLTILGTTVVLDVMIGAVAWTGSAIVSEVSINSGTKEIVTYNISLQGTGEFKKKTA